MQNLKNNIDLSIVYSDVLVIEDQPAHSTLIARALKGVVGEIICASTGKEGLQLAVEKLPDLVICDFHLPDMTALDVLTQLSSLRPGLPVIVLTSSKSIQDAIGAMRVGAWDYMVKEFTDDFKEQLQIILERTAERRAYQLREIELSAERNALYAAAATSKDGVAVLSNEGTVIFCNKACSEFIAFLAGTKGIATASNIIELIEGYDKTVAKNLHLALQSKNKNILWSSEIALKFENQEQKGLRSYELSLSKTSRETSSDLSIKAGFEQNILWVADITKRKEIEQFQRDLLSMTTHDLKGPLGAILTSSELLEETVKEKRDKDIIARIASCARNCISIIDELLSARRIQDGMMVIKPRWLNVKEVIEDVMLDFSPMAKVKPVTVQLSEGQKGLQIYADKLALTRVLGNLLHNAIKFTEPHGRITFTASKQEKGMKITIADTGCGIDAKERFTLFDRYTRLEKHSATEGTGLGLFVVRNIVDAHGGKVEMQSQVGAGTTFFLFFPDGPKDS